MIESGFDFMDLFGIIVALLGTGICAVSTALIALCLYALRRLPSTQELLARHLGGHRSRVTSAGLLCIGWYLILFTDLSLDSALVTLILGLSLSITALLVLQKPDPALSATLNFSPRILPVLISISLALSPFVIFARVYRNVSSMKWGLIR